jgi:thioredoxin 1
VANDINKEEFNKLANENLPLIVDFWASWCGPCKMLIPIFDELAEEYKDKLNFAKVNVENEEELTSENGIMGVPCLIVFNEGKEVDRITGFMQKEQLKEKIDEILGKI